MMKVLRIICLIVSIVMVLGSSAAIVFFSLQPLGGQFAVGMIPFLLIGLGLTGFWMWRILDTAAKKTP